MGNKKKTLHAVEKKSKAISKESKPGNKKLSNLQNQAENNSNDNFKKSKGRLKNKKLSGKAESDLTTTQGKGKQTEKNIEMTNQDNNITSTSERLTKKEKRKPKKQNTSISNDNNNDQGTVSNVYVKKFKNKKKLKLAAKKSNTVEEQTDVTDSSNITEQINQVGDIIKKKKSKLKKIRTRPPGDDESELPTDTTKCSPNADKFLLISLIKNVLKKKSKAIPVARLQSKVIEKFCQKKGVEETPEIVKLFQKSLNLTYGVKISDDCVKLVVSN